VCAFEAVSALQRHMVAHRMRRGPP
jgi:hypothetical protein